MQESKMYAFIINPKKEAKIKSRILQILSRKHKGEPNAFRQSELHKMIGCGIRAAYFGYLLETLQEEKVIMKDSSHRWALWDAPRNIAQREWWDQCDREAEERKIAWANSPAGKAERARKEAEERKTRLERFNQRLYNFLAGNEEELFMLVRRIYVSHKPKSFKHSMFNY